MLDPSRLETVADRIKEVSSSLPRHFENDGSDIYAYEHYMLALASLEQAERQMRLASYHQARGNNNR